MELKEILHRVDHTLLAQTASWEEVKALCEDALKYETASVCIRGKSCLLYTSPSPRDTR